MLRALLLLLLGFLHRVVAADAGGFKEALHAWEAEMARPAQWTVLHSGDVTNTSGAVFALRPDGSCSCQASPPLDKDVYTFVVRSNLQGITAFRVEVLTSGYATARIGHARDGNAVLTEFQVTAAPAGAKGIAGTPIALRKASADFAQKGWPASAAIDGDRKTGWAFLPEVATNHVAVFETAAPIAVSGANGEVRLVFTLRQERGGRHVLGAFRISATTQRPPPQELPARLRRILALEPSEREAGERAELADFFRAWSKLRQ